MNILDEIKQSFKEGSVLTRIIYINLAVFVFVKLVNLFFFLFLSNPNFSIASWLAVPASFGALFYKPWTLISYMFLHEDFLHILFNMLWLFWFGKIFLQFIDSKKFIAVYILGGLSGALFYILSFNFFPVFQTVVGNSMALGASASVMAIVVAISFYAPNFKVYLLFFGEVKLKYIAMVSILLDVISIPTSNSGGHLAHIGGALFGFIFISSYKKNKNFTDAFSNFILSIFSIFKPKQKMKVSYKKASSDWDYNANKKTEQAEVDEILDKIAKSGYDSLTKIEKEKLFKASK